MNGNLIKLLTALISLLAFGCSTMNGARPLASGQHEIGLILGGPMVNLGGSGIPIPSAILGARTGLNKVLDRSFELDYGLNLTGIAFGVGQTHIGASWQLSEQSDFVPAVTLTDRFYLASDGKTFWAVNQQEILLSWLIKDQLIYTGIGNYIDLGNLSDHLLRLTPVVGLTIDPFEAGGFRYHLEGRWFALNKEPEIEAITWVPSDRGAYGLNFGFSYQF